MHRSNHWFGVFGALAGLAFTLAACSSDDSSTGDDSASSGDDSASSGDDSASSGDDSSSSSGDDSTSSGDDNLYDPSANMPVRGERDCAGLTPTDRTEALTSGELTTSGQDGVACTGVSIEPEGMPVRAYLLMDRSISMDEPTPGYDSRWDAIRTAVEDFIAKPEAANIEIGYGKFTLGPNGEYGGDGELSQPVCNADTYSEPIVPFGLPADVGDDILSDMADTSPAGWTPTAPALEGALQYAKDYAESHTDRETVVVLLTDAYPTMCLTENEPDGPNRVAQMAAVAGWGYDEEPSIRTFVMGIEADFNLNQVALYGGTNTAYSLDPDEGDVTEAMVDRLLSIASSDLACNLELPPPPASSGQEFNPDKVVVKWTSPLGSEEEIPKVSGEAACDDSAWGGWYYLDEDARQIALCPCSCSRMGGGTITVAAGCDPVMTLG